MINTMVKVKCTTEGCSQQGFTKTVQRFVGTPGPGLAFKADIICLGCGCEPRFVDENPKAGEQD